MSSKAELQSRLVDYLETIGAEPIQRGNNWKAKCPLHADTHPSLEVKTKDGVPVWKCWPCDVGGDVFTLHQKRTGGSFKEALQGVAEVLGVTPPGPDRRQSATKPLVMPQPKKKPELPMGFEAAHRAARVRLYESPELQERFAAELGVSPETIRSLTFTDDALGFSPQPYYRDKEGKVQKTRPNRLLYLYPTGAKVRHPFGPDSKTRFLWSVGNPVQPWRAHFLERPEVRRVYLTEGESDAIALLEAGVPYNAVMSSPGTSFMEEWGELFRDKEVVLCFDNDEAGQNAVPKVAKILKPFASSVSAIKWEGVAA